MVIIDQPAYWNNEGGARWKRYADRLAVTFAPLTQALMQAAAPQNGERVLDVGCGCGYTTIELARRVGPAGRVVGLDVSRPLQEAARENLTAQKIANAQLVLADASTHDFGEERFDLLVSQFGIMFFSDPVAAFENLRAALSPRGRLAFACWRDRSTNPWVTLPLETAAPFAPPLEQPAPDAPGPMAFQDRDRVERILAEAGFTDVVMRPHDAQLVFGTDPHSVAEQMANLGATARLLQQVDAEKKAAATEAIAKALRAYVTQAGVVFPAGIWLVGARA